MLSFDIHEIAILIMNEDHKQILIRICPGLMVQWVSRRELNCKKKVSS